ncbi:hypothetical protein Clim_1821 [Chlorobium limicola DSM 245]|uniref:Uncharacterized protein n=1 Tax=Chlorobium limicola (strain DSM 245 / NBRC 103803 / 6330) TaxID=290315 RepID=B3EEZ8_CHLL2|nr:hypothetical protein Clim_1821 [Chlorobium limicola DSM 245]
MKQWRPSINCCERFESKDDGVPIHRDQRSSRIAEHNKWRQPKKNQLWESSCFSLIFPILLFKNTIVSKQHYGFKG